MYRYLFFAKLVTCGHHLLPWFFLPSLSLSLFFSSFKLDYFYYIYFFFQLKYDTRKKIVHQVAKVKFILPFQNKNYVVRVFTPRAFWFPLVNSARLCYTYIF